jgi:hypothetical protein
VDIKKGRTNLCPNEQFLQCAALRLPKGTTFKAHRHNWNQVNEERLAQESWFIQSGMVAVWFYDLDGVLMDIYTLNEGDASFTFEGGHTYGIQNRALHQSGSR